MEKNIYKIGKELFITSDEKIKEGDYVIWNGKVYKDSKRSFTGVDYSQCKKIILTTDQDLIADGVEAIDDDFLDWFVKNPSCEYVQSSDSSKDGFYNSLFIPQEEPKQETLEEAAANLADPNICKTDNWISGAKYQAERMYSEEEVVELLTEREQYTSKAPSTDWFSIPHWFKQFKKK